MALIDYRPQTREINFNGGSFRVEGLSLSALEKLIRGNLADLQELFSITEAFLSGRQQITKDDLGGLALTLAKNLPGLTASVIALGSGEEGEEAVAAAKRLSAPLQIEALVAIGTLTFEEVGGIKKFVETMKTLFNKTGLNVPTKLTNQ